MAEDPEYVEQALAGIDPDKLKPSTKGPAASTWTAEVGKLNEVVNELRGLRAILLAVNSKPGSARPAIEPSPVPETLFDRRLRKLKQARRLERHHDLARKLLGDRAGQGLPPLLT